MMPVIAEKPMQGRASLATHATVDAAPHALPAITRRRAFWRTEWFLFVLFVAPNLFFFSVFSFWPIIYSAWLSFHRWDLIAPVKQYVGIENYRYLLYDDVFHKVLLNTLTYTIGAVGGTLLLGLLLALLLNQPLRWRDGARAVIFAPSLLSGAAISVVWIYMFDPRFGVIARLLSFAHLSSPTWLTDPDWAMPAVLIVSIWKDLGFATVIFLAGLQAIPRDLYEAAKIDGAGAWWRFRSVTIPMLSPIVFFLGVTTILNTFQSFDIIQVMTKGGPVDATNTLIYYVYQEGFVAFNAGRSSAASLVLFAIMLGVTLLQVRYGERKVHYG